jgi:proteasome assembly chaperone (PAC2) family protein
VRILNALRSELLFDDTGDSVSVIQTSQLMLYREIIAVCSEIHTKHITTLCGQNVGLVNVKLAVRRVADGI